VSTFLLSAFFNLCYFGTVLLDAVSILSRANDALGEHRCEKALREDLHSFMLNSPGIAREVHHEDHGNCRWCRLTDAPFSMYRTPKKAGLYADRADARVVHRRRTFYGYYDVPYYGALAYPRLMAPTPYYGIAPYAGITPYGVMPYPYSVGPPTGGFFMGSK
jgi:hypothetical protein